MDLSELMALNENAIQELKRENPYMTLSLKNHIDSNDSFKRSVRYYRHFDLLFKTIICFHVNLFSSDSFRYDCYVYNFTSTSSVSTIGSEIAIDLLGLIH